MSAPTPENARPKQPGVPSAEDLLRQAAISEALTEAFPALRSDKLKGEAPYLVSKLIAVPGLSADKAPLQEYMRHLHEVANVFARSSLQAGLDGEQDVTVNDFDRALRGALELCPNPDSMVWWGSAISSWRARHGEEADRMRRLRQVARLARGKPYTEQDVQARMDRLQLAFDLFPSDAGKRMIFLDGVVTSSSADFEAQCAVVRVSPATLSELVQLHPGRSEEAESDRASKHTQLRKDAIALGVHFSNAFRELVHRNPLAYMLLWLRQW